ncbi:hypothetical protein ACFQY4_10680 [Catellatospora bangladeshensis]|uniref:hypothetical protein n=1 Tax=Catellatospora bangladeshensis TaxID=310355 RepID=UPI00361CDDC5
MQLIADLTREIDKLRNTEVLTDEQLKVLQDGLGYISGRALIGRWNDVRKRAESLEKRVHNWAQDAEDDARETLEPVEDLLKEIGDFAKNRD